MDDQYIQPIEDYHFYKNGDPFRGNGSGIIAADGSNSANQPIIQNRASIEALENRIDATTPRRVPFHSALLYGQSSPLHWPLVHT